MRKSAPFLLLTLLISLFFLSSCERRLNNDSHISFEAEQLGPDEIEGETKGSIFNIGGIQTDANGFRVLAYPCATSWATNGATALPTIMHNQVVKWESSAWTYTPVKVWPSSGTVSFFAYYPYITSATFLSPNTTPGTPTIQYITPLNVADQIDLLAAQQIDKLKGVGGYDKVNFQFKHILSCIGFSAKRHNMCGANTIRVKKLTVTHKNNRKNATYTFGTTDDAPGSWSGASPASSPTTSILYENATGKAVTYNTNTTPTQLNDDDKFLMLIPQVLTVGVLTLDVTYSIDGRADITKTIALPKGSALTLEQGEKYTYTLIISADKIEYDAPTVEEWPLLSAAVTSDVKATTKTIVTDNISNCYIINRGEGIYDFNANNVNTVFRFPAIQRINQFWGDKENGGVAGDGANIHEVNPSTPATAANGDGYTALGNGNNAIGASESWYAQVIWSDIPGITNDQATSLMTITQNKDNPGIGDKYLEVTFKPKADNSSYSGNVVIGVTQGETYDSGTFIGQLKYLWSWHLWVINHTPETQYINMNVALRKDINNNLLPYPVMDRNLGANDELGTGLYYQWGRKDPFNLPGSVSPNNYATTSGATGIGRNATIDAGTLINCVYRPNCRIVNGTQDEVIQTGNLSGATGYNRWGGAESHTSNSVTKSNKTIYDPCPPGWRMPWGANWSGITTTSTTFNWSSQTGYIGRVFTGISSPNTSTHNLFKVTGHLSHTADAILNPIYGYYWTGSPNAANSANALYFGDALGITPNQPFSRRTAIPLRCVYINETL